MKTIDEAATDAAKKSINSIFDKNGLSTSTFKQGFKECAKFLQRWIPIEEELPVAFESGNWDGLRSEFVVAKDKKGEWHKARCYAGHMDGSEFCCWADARDYDLEGIVEWRPLEFK